MLKVYTDGSCWPNTGEGNGTYGFLVVDNNENVIHSHIDGREKTTNNRMELLGIISAFKYLNANHGSVSNITIFSDSQYCVKGFNTWYFGWIKSETKLSKIKNLDMWHYLHGLRSPNIELKWVKGHASNKFNNLIDELISEEFAKRYGTKPKY